MHLTAWATLAALVVYFWMSINVGRARGRYQVKAPSMEGPEEFQRAVRVQINTLEQMAIFLPALWMCAYFLCDRWAAAGGLAWAIGRLVYALSYYRDPAKRGVGFGITMLASLSLMAGTVIGLIVN